jgi:hypothetical protein
MSAAAPISCAKKKNDELGLCVDYRAFNIATVRNQYSHPLRLEMLNTFCGAQIFVALDLRNAYDIIRVRESNKYKPRSALWMGSMIIERYHSRKRTHQQLSKPISITAYVLTLATSLCATVIICWSTRPMKRSMESKYEMCCNNYKHMVFTAQPKSAILGSHWSAFTDVSFAIMALPWHRIA